MFSFLGLESPEQRKRREENRKAEAVRRIPLAVPWVPDMKWERQMNLIAATWPTWHLFDVKAGNAEHPAWFAKNAANHVLSPDETFMYVHRRLPSGYKLDTFFGRKRGDVLFDGDLDVAVLYRKERWNDERWDERPWMGITPMEVMTLRCGERFAKGRTVIAGLGLGWQLHQVSHRKQVKEIVLVEMERSLVDWILPVVKPRLGPVKLEVIVGDAREVVPKLTADAVLVDIDQSYGGNDFPTCPNIKKTWVWGSQYVEGSNSIFG